ncbi:MAG: DUF3793 family protein [Lachnospiraceae bacterium]|nr:DUF3793 family protein [Lachnospiraceae bacterium]
MSGKNLQNGLIEHCAPTLAGLKSANLFRYFFDSEEDTEREIEEVNRLLNGRGVYVEALQWVEKAVLIYTYRFSHLQRELNNPEAEEMLLYYGYPGNDITNCITHLKTRLLSDTCFPHEIGIFLGYPLEDVKGFIVNKGKNCKCCGLWKVYGDETDKIQQFHKLKKCTEIYQQVFAEGRKLEQMTVCA